MTNGTTGLACLAILAAASAAGAAETWAVDGLDTPESALFDAERGVLYVSNITGDILERDGTGYIARMSPEGEMLTRNWVEGLDAPKGLALSGNTLYVADIDRLVAIDVDAGAITGIWTAEGAVFLNDTAVDEDGRVYVSDTLANRIHVLADGALSVLAEGDALKHPNGLAISDGVLLVASWGEGLRDDLTTEVGGNLLSVDLETGAVSDFGSGAPVGNLDGLEPDGAGNWLVTDWVAGALYRISPDGGFELLRDLPQGSANLEYLEDSNTVVIPQMLDGRLVAETLD
jgi:DNA-binding beta-propeller fold protein YncE